MIPSARKQFEKSNGTSSIKVPELLDDFSKLCFIRSGAGIVPFHLYDYQSQIAKLIDRFRFIQIFKTRQLGLTELGGVRSFHKAIKHPEYAGAFLSIGQKESSNISKRIKLLNSGLRVSWQIESQTELQPFGGGNIKCRPSTINSLRGLESMWDIFVDEAAFIDDIEEIYASSIPSQSMVEASGNAATIICSTMSEEGKASWFWRLMDSNNGDLDAFEIVQHVKTGMLPPFFWWVDLKGWCKIIVHWKAHPIYSKTPNFLAEIKQKTMMSDAQVEREYNLGIPEAGGLLFNLDYIELYCYGEWETVQPGGAYLFTIDPNFGGEDFFCLLIWRYDGKPYRLVCEFAEQNRSVKTYCIPQVQKLAGIFHPKVIAIETNSGGTVIAETLAENCPDAEIIEINTNKTSKRVMTDRTAFMFEGGDFIIPPDWVGIKEMGQFSLLERQAIKGHDDRITSWMLFGAVIKRALELIGDMGGMSEIGDYDESDADESGLRNKLITPQEAYGESDLMDWLMHRFR